MKNRNTIIISIWILSSFLFLKMLAEATDILRFSSELLSDSIELGIATVLICLLALRMHRSGLGALFRGKPNFESLLSLGTLACLASAILKVLDFLPASYAALAAVVIAFNETAFMLQVKLRRKKSAIIAILEQYLPKEAKRIGPSGNESLVEVEDLSWGDIVTVDQGEYIPVDGKISEGTSQVDELLIYGKRIPADRNPGDQVFAGTKNVSAPIRIEVQNFGEETSLAQIIRKMARTIQEHSTKDLAKDSGAGVLLLIIAVLAAASTLLWTFAPEIIGRPLILILNEAPWLAVARERSIQALSGGLTVLISVCAAAFTISGPIASQAAVKWSAKKGVRFLHSEALYRSAEIKTMVFDRSGTVTSGQPEVSDAVSFYDEEEFYALLLALESKIEHPLAKTLSNLIRNMDIKPAEIQNFSQLPGKGVQAEYKGKQIFIGSADYIQSLSYSVESFEEHIKKTKEEGKTTLLMAEDETVVGLVGFTEPLRPEIPELVDAFFQKEINTILLSGPNRNGASGLALEAGIDKVYADLNPNDKVDILRGLQVRGEKVGMIGDGVNDVAAFVQADIGIAVADGEKLIAESADVIVHPSCFPKLVDILPISRKFRKHVRRSGRISMFFAGLSVLLAFFGIFHPIIPLIVLFGSILFLIPRSLALSRGLERLENGG